MASIDCIYLRGGYPERDPILVDAKIDLISKVAKQMNREHDCFGKIRKLPLGKSWEPLEGARFRLTPHSDYNHGMDMYGFFLRLCGGLQPDAVMVDHEDQAKMARHYEGSFWGRCETPMICDRNPDPIKLNELLAGIRNRYETQHSPHWRSFPERVIRVLHKRDKIPVNLDVSRVSFDVDPDHTKYCCLCDELIDASTHACVVLATFKGDGIGRLHICMECLFDEVGGPPPVNPIVYPKTMEYLQSLDEKIPVIEIPEE